MTMHPIQIMSFKKLQKSSLKWSYTHDKKIVFKKSRFTFITRDQITISLLETKCVQDSMNIPKIEFITQIFVKL